MSPKKLDNICAKLWSKKEPLISKTSSIVEKYSSMGKPTKLPFSIDSILNDKEPAIVASTSKESTKMKSNNANSNNSKKEKNEIETTQMEKNFEIETNDSPNIFLKSIMDFTQKIQQSKLNIYDSSETDDQNKPM